MTRRATGAWLGVLLPLLLFGAAARGAEMFYLDRDLLTNDYVGPAGPLVISGEIEPGDQERLLAKIGGDLPRFLSQNKIILASNGGDVAETLKIARLIQGMFTLVSVSPQTGACVGACFLIYAAAAQRVTDGEHLIGLHRPALLDSVMASRSSADAGALETRALAQVRAFLLANRVPDDLLEQMFERPVDGVYWLSARDEQALGSTSAAFHRELVARCAWDDSLERDVLAGRRPYGAALGMFQCRARLAQAEARKVLAGALGPRPASR